MTLHCGAECLGWSLCVACVVAVVVIIAGSSSFERKLVEGLHVDFDKVYRDQFSITMDNVSPGKDNEYVEMVFDVPEKFRKGYHVVSFAPKLDFDEGATPPHHIILETCGNEFRSDMPRFCMSSRLVFVWAHHGSNFSLPDGVGLNLEDVGSFKLEIHYKTDHKGKKDRSGVTMGVLPGRACNPLQVRIFAPSGYSFELKPNQSLISIHQDFPFYAPWEEGFKVFAFRVHAHDHGIENSVHIYRQGLLQHVISRATNLPQSFVYLDEPFMIKHDDVVQLSCLYNTLGETKVIKEGSTDKDEMCNVYLMGYPVPKSRKALENSINQKLRVGK